MKEIRPDALTMLALRSALKNMSGASSIKTDAGYYEYAVYFESPEHRNKYASIIEGLVGLRK